MSASSKSQLLDKVYALLSKRYKLGPRGARMSVLEGFVYGICHEGTTREQANQAMSRFKDAFFDWNELRVSSLPEIRDALVDLPEPEAKAQRLRKFLRQLFERTYGFELDQLTKKPLKESIKSLREFEAGRSDFVLATVVQQSLGGHAIPIDEPIHRCLERLGIAEPDAPAEALRSSLERAVPKNRGAEFVDLLEELAHDTCTPGEPDCPRCALVKVCPTGHRRTSTRSASGPGPTPPSDGPAPSRRSGPSKKGGDSPQAGGKPPRRSSRPK